jgi:hypothetical protein
VAHTNAAVTRPLYLEQRAGFELRLMSDAFYSVFRLTRPAYSLIWSWEWDLNPTLYGPQPYVLTANTIPGYLLY